MDRSFSGITHLQTLNVQEIHLVELSPDHTDSITIEIEKEQEEHISTDTVHRILLIEASSLWQFKIEPIKLTIYAKPTTDIHLRGVKNLTISGNFPDLRINDLTIHQARS